mmetsp:Transcript_26966/g.64758  ORF Transcript_26966/g.64758 Transcript_26966/m.64758 type:complete len:90 (+) Transcript_26966:308-577(+)
MADIVLFLPQHHRDAAKYIILIHHHHPTTPGLIAMDMQIMLQQLHSESIHRFMVSSNALSFAMLSLFRSMTPLHDRINLESGKEKSGRT